MHFNLYNFHLVSKLIIQLCIFTLLMFAFFSQASAQGLLGNSQDEQFLPAEQAFPFKLNQLPNKNPTDEIHLRIHWDIAEGYYLYQTSINLLSHNNAAIAPNQFDQNAIIKFDPNFDKDMAIFKHSLRAEFIVKANQLPVTLKFQGCAEAGLCYPMQIHPLQVIANLPSLSSSSSTSISTTAPITDTITNTVPESQLNTVATNPTIGIQNSNTNFNSNFLPETHFENLLAKASLFKIIIIFLVLGIGLCLTPCVLPMMPIISGIVLGRDKAFSTLQAFGISSTYVLTMSLTYTVVGVLAASLGASANIQIWMQNPLVLSIFAALFLILALSMFDVYELRLPQALTQKLNDISGQQQGGSYLSAGIMGILSAVVVSPCISAPLAGALVFISSTGDVLIGGSALFALGIGMGLPLIALCTFGTSFLPKAGAWLNYSKRFFGLLLIAVAIWMISRFINPQITLALWGVLLIFSAFSFGNWQNANPLLKTLLILLLLWGAMMVIGAALGNSKPLQPLENLSQKNLGADSINSENFRPHEKLIFETITSSEELQTVLNKNSSSGKILLLDFYADWCTSCKEVEEDIFENPQFENFLKKVTLVRADLSKNSVENFELLEQLELFGPPSILFFDTSGQEIKALRIQGVITPENFQRIVEQLQL